MTDYIVPSVPIWSGGGPSFIYPEDPPNYYWTGAYPYLDTADEGASGGVLNDPPSGSSAWCGLQFPAWVAPAGVIGVRIEYQYLLNSPSSANDLLILPADSSYFGESYRSGVTAGVWNTVSDPAFVTSGQIPDVIAGLAAGGTVAVMDFGYSSLYGGGGILSMMRLVVTAGVPINQQLQRRDGLGRGGVPLARGQATRQSSNQARVTY